MATNIPFPHKLVLNRFLLSLFGGHAHELDQDTFREVTRRLTKAMEEASASLAFEQAAVFRDQIQSLHQVHVVCAAATHQQLSRGAAMP